MKMNERYPTTYLSTPDFEQPRVLTISHCTEMEVGNDEQSEKKPVLFFQGVERGWPLNKTNWTSIEQITGKDNDDNWGGLSDRDIQDTDTVRGKMVDCARVRVPGTEPQVVPQPVPRAAQFDRVAVPVEDDRSF